MKILIAGDYCPIERVGEQVEKGEFASVFSDVQDIVHQADYAIINFECPVCTGEATPIEKHGPNLRCSEKGVEAIQWAGFQCVTLANNHFLDYGPDGVQETIETLDRLGIDHVGGGMTLKDASAILYKTVGEKTLAIVNCCEHEFSIATELTAGSNPLNPVRQYKSIQEARCKADYVLVIVHGGHEHFQLPSPRMVETYRFFIDAGADAVVNHHQHCFSGFEVYNGKPIFYGLGNFCFDNKSYRTGNWTEGYGVMIDFSEADTTFTLHPYLQCGQEAKVKLLPANAFDEKIAQLNDIISNEERLAEAVGKDYSSRAKHYSNIFEPFYNRLYLALKYRGLLPSFIGKKRRLAARNFVECEAHRDRLLYWLNHENTNTGK